MGEEGEMKHEDIIKIIEHAGRWDRFDFRPQVHPNPVIVSCVKCGTRIAEGMYDKLGKAFVDYYCFPCYNNIMGY